MKSPADTTRFIEDLAKVMIQHTGQAHAPLLHETAEAAIALMVASMTPGVKAIADERNRTAKRWGNDHDQQHPVAALVDAAQCYAEAASMQIRGVFRDSLPPLPIEWPWDSRYWRPSINPMRNLEKAGALIASEWDRLHYAAPPEPLTELEGTLGWPGPEMPAGEPETPTEEMARVTAWREGYGTCSQCGQYRQLDPSYQNPPLCSGCSPF